MSENMLFWLIWLFCSFIYVLSQYHNYSGIAGQNAYNQPHYGAPSYNNTPLATWQNNPRPYAGSPNGGNYQPSYNNTHYNNGPYRPFTSPRPYGGSSHNSTFGSNQRPPYNNTHLNNGPYIPSTSPRPYGGSSVNSTFGSNQRPPYNNTHLNNGPYIPFTSPRPYGGSSVNSTFGSNQRSSYNNTHFNNGPYNQRPYGGSPVNSTFGRNYYPSYNNTPQNTGPYNPRPYGGSPVNSTIGRPQIGSNYRPPYNNTTHNNGAFRPFTSPRPYGGSPLNSTFGRSPTGNNQGPFHNTIPLNGPYRQPYNNSSYPYGTLGKNCTSGFCPQQQPYYPSPTTSATVGPFPTWRYDNGGTATSTYKPLYPTLIDPYRPTNFTSQNIYGGQSNNGINENMQPGYTNTAFNRDPHIPQKNSTSWPHVKHSMVVVPPQCPPGYRGVYGTCQKVYN